MKLIEAASPNFDDRGRDIDMVILHYTGMPTGAAALERMRDPASKVSAHYMVEENGRVFRLVDEEKRAWHAGRASWKGETDINARSIGIEIVNPGHEFSYRDFPAAQIDAVVALLKEVVSRRAIEPSSVLGHSDVAPRRKEDPGEKFPWARLAAAGLALAPYDGDGAEGAKFSYSDGLGLLRAIGYDAPDGDHAAGLLAFQRRFCPAALGQGFNPITKAALAYAAQLHGVS
ncbi:MAG: N-acetylmuramoyl-L-alanine amidase [Pseudomonadota bacterium]